MKRVLASAVLFILLSSATLVSQQSSTPNTSQRFQLIATQVQDDSGRKDGSLVTVPALFLVDTKTGKVWRHAPVKMEDENGKRVFKEREHFYLIEFSLPDSKSSGYSSTPPE
jgi:hypothetical protein